MEAMIVIYTQEQSEVMEQFVERQNKLGLAVQLLDKE